MNSAITNYHNRKLDIFSEFFSENLVSDPSSSLLKFVVFASFREWYRQSYNSRHPFSNKQLFNFFAQRDFFVDDDINGFIHGVQFPHYDFA